MTIGIIIATHNRCSLLKDLLDAIKFQNLPLELNLITIIIDDGSEDGTSEMLRDEYPEMIYIRGNGNWWWTKCMNTGFQKAIELELENVLILNDDNIIEPEYISTIYNDIANLEDKSILGSASVSLEDKGRIDSAGARRFNKLRFKFDNYYKANDVVDKNFKGVRRTKILSGRGTLIPVKLFNVIGFYDERLVQYSSDDDFILRAGSSGIPVYITYNAIVYNYTSLTSSGRGFGNETIINVFKSLFDKHSSNSISKHSIMYWKHSYKLLLPVYIMAVIAVTLLNHIKRRLIIRSAG